MLRRIFINLLFFILLIEKPSKLCIRIQPVQSYSDGIMEWDLSKRMVWNGLLQTPLPKVCLNFYQIIT